MMVSAFSTESKKGIAFEESYRFMVLAFHARQSRESSNAGLDGCSSVVKCIGLPLQVNRRVTSSDAVHSKRGKRRNSPPSHGSVVHDAHES